MGIFVTRRRDSSPRPGVERPQDGGTLPPHLAIVGEALAGETGSVDACWEAGRRLASAGTSMGEALDGLRSASRSVRGRDPDFRETSAVATGWAEATLGYLHRLSCDDPATGLSSQAHLRARLAETYRRQGETTRRSHALVVVEATPPGTGVELARSLTLLGELVRTTVPVADAVGRAGVRRVLAVAERDERLPRRVALLRRMAGDVAPGARVWIEGLPGTDDAAAALLDELARH